MHTESDDSDQDDMRPEYDLRGGVRGKYYKQYMEGANVVLLDPDAAAVFHDSPDQDGQANSTKTDQS
jgi:hypothetical protein